MGRKIIIVNPVSAMQLELEAQKTLKDFQPEALVKPVSVNVEKFFEGRLPKLTGVKTDVRYLSPGIYGWTDSENMEVVISAELMDSDQESQRRRARATIVHECDHAMRHIPQFKQRQNRLHSIHDGNHNNVRLHRQEDVPAYMNPEWQSWRWGKAFIMPLPIIVALHNKGVDVYEMAEIFDVNPKFVLGRLADLQRMNIIKA